MGKIIVRFTTKTSSASLNDAIKIAEICEHHKEGNFYFVHFDEPNNNLQKLLGLVKSWKTTQIFLNDNEVNVKSIFNTYFCPDKLLCGGGCTHPKIGWMKLSEFLERTQIEKGIGYVDEYAIQSLTPFLEKTGDKKFKLNKDKLLDYVKNEWFFELEHCPIINADKTLDLIKKFPDKIEIRGRFGGFEDREEDEEDKWECEHCEKGFDLEEKQEDELEEKGKINIKCPHCNKMTLCEYEDEDKENEEEEGFEYDEKKYKKIAEIFSDVFEIRFKKILKEVLKNKK